MKRGVIVPDAGLWSDGSFGHPYTREGCATTIKLFANRLNLDVGEPDRLIAALCAEMSDDAWEEFEACEWLNHNVPRALHSWGWQDGDFGLWPDEEGE